MGTMTFVVMLLALAVLILGARDAHWHRCTRKRLSDLDRIAQILDHTRSMTSQLQMILDDHHDTFDRSVVWIPLILDYYRQLETFASLANPSAEECDKLADEADQYMRVQGLSGIDISRRARELSTIIRSGPAG